MKNLILVLIILVSTKIGISQTNTNFLNCNYIVYNKEYNIRIDSLSREWGENVLKELNIGDLSNSQKAKVINDYISRNFKYNWKRRFALNEIIEKENGFCISHALLGIFLFRLADVPAKFAHEVHLMKPNTILSLMIGHFAKKDNEGINSYWHNDHVWVWFFDGENWEPFDSALGICGYDEFYNKRFYQHKELSKGFAQKWTGPPFVIWEDTGSGIDDMKNISYNIWNNKTLQNDSLGWVELVKIFQDYNHSDFHKSYLDDQKIGIIKEMSGKWF